MNRKTVIQLVLFTVIIIVLAIFFFKYFDNSKKKNITERNDKLINQKLDTKDNSLDNIEYITTDNKGNQYIIRALSGYIDDENPELIIMQNIWSEITFYNSEKIQITSRTAVYNAVNFNTKFNNNVKIIYGKHKINCEKSDLIFSENLAKLYDNIIYENVYSKLFADKMEIDLITKDTKVYMNDINSKVKIIHKNGNN
jgi:hypothetical protein